MFLIDLLPSVVVAKWWREWRRNTSLTFPIQLLGVVGSLTWAPPKCLVARDMVCDISSPDGARAIGFAPPDEMMPDPRRRPCDYCFIGRSTPAACHVARLREQRLPKFSGFVCLSFCVSVCTARVRPSCPLRGTFVFCFLAPRCTFQFVSHFAHVFSVAWFLLFSPSLSRT